MQPASSSSSSTSLPTFFNCSLSKIFNMDSYDFSVNKSPRKELQGPRPPALKVRKDSYKINKKPPVAPQQSQQQQHQQQTQLRPPVIIYTVSPKVIHTNPSDFMNLVQRLTGSSSSSNTCSTSSSSSSFSTCNNNALNDDNMMKMNNGAMSPAARYATIEKAAKPPKAQNKMVQPSGGEVGFLEGIVEMSQVMERSTMFPGILSPGPASLSPIPPSLFSPPSDPNPIGFFHDLSPVLHSNRGFMDNSFIIPSPSNFVSPHLNSPSFDLFNNFFDL